MTARTVAADVARHEQWITTHEQSHTKDDKALEHALASIEGKLDRLQWWMLGVVAGYATSLTVGVIIAVLRMLGH